MLITVYFPIKNEDFDYTKCIIPENKLDFFIKLGAVETQLEAENLLKVLGIEKPKRKPGRPKLNK